MVNELIYYVDDKPYQVEIIYKRMKNIYFRFNGEKFKVTCPRNTKITTIKSGLDKYAKKIISRNVKFNAESDEYIYLFGNKIDLSYPGEINFSDGSVLSYKDNIDLHKKLKKWFLNVLKRRTEYYAKLMHAPSYFVKLRKMKSRYGSNNRNTKTITYSLTLIHYSIEIIDSVVVHELTHCFVYDHSDNFYRLLYKYCPNYDTLRKKLIHAEFK